ncbi:uncharacterized protein BP5553_10416 [Venustampulla echinocandica]|uniref:CFEM domain-containing protein n=1 Tax=Venustampulla echinocandica TaxID=2656787 RepID=A0A370T996_9HELO|nr:uncharacterized protein BP5553_10416 [Venustampulla echinocandica]RDL30138.1 hypothetical protein BP5553_10416 [Venustampulla echinocandica]
MKGLWGIIVAVLAFAPLAIAQMPGCALTCLMSALPASSCAATDQPCICADTALNAHVMACIQTTCTVKEQLTTANATAVACDAPVRNKTSTYAKFTIIFYCLSTVAVIIRMITIFGMGQEFGYDDGCVIFIFFINTAIMVLAITGLTRYGIGQDIWKLPFDSITNALFYFWVSEPLYYLEAPLIKIAFLLFFHRIFTDQTITRIIWTLIAVNVMVIITFVVALCFICRPISYSWNSWDGEHTGTCGNANALAFSNAGICILLDCIIIALPITRIMALQLSLRRRISILFMLCVGTFVTIVSILRLQSLVTFENTANPTWDFYGTGIWSTMELDVGIICLCMPSLRAFLIRLFPTLSSRNRSQYPSIRMQSDTRKTGSTSKSSRNNGKGGISLSRNFVVEYSNTPAQDQSSFVQLVEIEAGRGDDNKS